MRADGDWNWEELLKEKPVAKGMFTQEQWDQIEHKLQPRRRGGRLLKSAAAICSLAALIMAALHLPWSDWEAGKSSHAGLQADNLYQATTDFPHMFIEQSDGNAIAKSDQGYYFLQGTRIYYMPASGGEPVLMNRHPNSRCKSAEDTGTCDPYLNNDNSELNLIQYYQNQLYVLESVREQLADGSFGTVWQLTRRDYDGMNREKVYTFSERPTAAAIHRGYLYYATGMVANSTTDGDDSLKERKRLLRVKLDKPATVEIMDDGTSRDETFVWIVPYGDQVYVQAEMKRKKSGRYYIKRYDLKDGTVSLLWKQAEGLNSMLDSIVGDRLYFTYFDNPDSIRTRTLFASDLNGNRIEAVEAPLPPIVAHYHVDAAYTFSLPNYWYWKDRAGMPYRLTVSKGGQTVQQLDATTLPKDLSWMAGDERYLFMRNFANRNQVYILDKRKLAEGKASIRLLLKSWQPEPS